MTHDMELYFLDWDGTYRSEQVTLSNAATGAVLDTEKVTSFHSGVYLEWAVSGNVLITITKLSGANAVLSGLFLGPHTTTSTVSATFINRDTTTEGNWIGAYGSQGYDVIGNTASIPSYAKVIQSGQQSVTWTASTTDPRALETANGTSRIAAAWYSSTSFTVDVNLSDGVTHDMELYFLDWDGTYRSEQVTLSNAATGAVLDTEKVTSFHSGVYLEWAVSGNVLITITKLSGANAVLSGLFFDPATVSNSLLVRSAVGNEIGTAWLVDANEVGSTSSFGGNSSQVALFMQGTIPTAGVAVPNSAVLVNTWQPIRARIAQDRQAKSPRWNLGLGME